MFNLSAITILFAVLGSSFSLHLLPSDVNKWDNGVVPLEIKGNYSPKEMDVLNAAIDSLHQETCIKFVPRTTEKDFITIQNTPTGCWAAVGKLGGQQMINFQSPQCTENIGTIQHELMHALGFVHVEHDDDDFYEQNSKNHPRAVMAKLNEAKLAKRQAHNDQEHHKDDHHDHDHHDHDHHGHNHNAGLAKEDIENINKMYECKKPTGVQAPIKQTA